MTEPSVLVVDGEGGLARRARTNGHGIHHVEAADALLEELGATDADAVMVGRPADGTTAVEVAALVRDSDPDLPIVVATDDETRAAAAETLDVTGIVSPDADADAVTATLSAATDRHRDGAAELLDDREAIDRLHRITADADRDPDARIESILDLGRRYLGVAAGLLTRADENAERLVQTAGDVAGLEPGTEIPIERTHSRRTLDRDGPLGVSNVPALGLADGPAEDSRAPGCSLGTTVVVDDEPFGTLCFVDADPGSGRPFTDSERSFVELLARWVGVELERDNRGRRLRTRTSEMEILAEHVPVVLFTLDADGTFLLSEGGALERLGLEPGELVGDSVFDVYGDHPQIRADCEQALAGERVWSTVEIGDLVFETQYRPIHDGGEVTRVVGAARDVTEQIRRQRELERYEAIVENIDDTAFVVDATGAIEFVNGRAADQAGRSAAELEGSDLGTVVTGLAATESDAERFQELLAAVQRGERDTARTELLLELPERDAVGDFQLSALESASDGRKVVGIARDVTALQEREQKLAQARERLQVALEGAHAGVWEWDPETDDMVWHDTCERLFGLDPGTFDGTYEAFRGHVHDEDIGNLESAIESALPEREPFEAEYRIERADGRTRWTYVRGEYAADRERYVGVISDVTELKAREQQVRKEQAFTESLLDALPDVFYAFDEDLSLVEYNDRIAAVTGHDPAELEGMSPRALIEDTDRLDEAIEAVFRGETTTFESGLVTSDGETLPYEFVSAPLTDADGEVAGFVGTGRDVTARRRHQATLASLHDTTRELVRSESAAEVARRVASVVRSLLPAAGAAVLLFDTDERALAPAGTAGDVPTQVPDVEPDTEDVAWQAFARGETMTCHGDRHVRGDCTCPGVLTGDGAIYLPLGDAGLLAVGHGTTGAPDDRTVELAEILAGNAAVALERIGREREVRERERELDRRADRLAQLDAVNERVRSVTHDLVAASTRGDIAQRVCTELAESDRFAFAWVGDYDGATGELTPEAWAGAENGYLDAVDLTERSDTPETRAVTDGEPVVVSNIADGLRDDPWRQEALSRRYGGVVSVPLRGGGVPHGVLSVYTANAGGLDEETRAVLVELGETVAHAIRAVDQRQALTSDQQVEVVFDLEGGQTSLLAFGGSLPGELTVDRVLAQQDQVHLAYGTVSGVDSERFERAAEGAVGIDDARVLDSSGDLSVELRVDGPSIARTVADHGGAFDRLTVSGSTGRLHAVFAAGGGVNEFIDTFVDRYPGSELAARRERREPAADTTIDAGGLDLTDRQREVIEAAHQSGFFEWPRRTTGEELADSLGVSGPTLQEHLRRAQRKLVRELLDG